MHSRVLIEGLLNLGRVDVLSAGNKHVLFAIDDGEIPAFVILGQVARVEPAGVVHGLGRCLRVVEVAGAETGAFEHQFAHFLSRQRLVVVVHDPGIHKEIGPADAPRFLNRIFRCERKYPGSELGHAKPLLETHPFFPRIFPYQRYGQRGAAAGAEAKG